MTIREIAELAGVSTSTVSKIMNNKAQSIHPETRERVLKIAKEYHYTPYSTVKSISQAKTFLLAVLLRSSGKANQLATGIVHAAQQHGYSVLIFDSQNDPLLELRHITTICQKHADGVLWEPVSPESTRQEHHFQDQDICFLYFNERTLPSAFTIDFTQMGYALTQKLIDNRHTRIACLMKPDNRRSQLVLEGFQKCLFDNQIPYDRQAELFISQTDYCLRLINNKATGIVSSHFAAALALYEQLDQLHYNIPSDFSLVSLKNDISDAASFPHISGIEIPYRKFGFFLCEQLIQACEKKESSASEVLYTPSCHFGSEDSIDMPSSLRSKKIAVVGSINIDNTFNVEALPQSGKTTQILNSSVTLGGKGANQAIGAARLGHEVSLLGVLGSDLDSSFAINALSSENIPTNGIFRDTGAQTGKAYIYIEKDGESTISILSGANALLSEERILQRRHLFKNVGYCLFSAETSSAAILEAARLGHHYGAKNIIKPCLIRQFPEELIPYTDILIPNRKEATALCPQYSSVPEQADYFFQLGIPTVIITLGHKGCYLRTKDVSRQFPAVQVTAVDTTGGADAFISALASYLTDGTALEKAVQIALCAASFCVTRQGVFPALVDKNTLESYIGRVNPELLSN